MNKRDGVGPVVEVQARQVEAHPDYRVLRRLDTSIEYPALAGPNVARAVILDTETTGMEFGTDKIVELGLVVFEYEKTSGQVGRVVGSFNELEDPGMAIPPAAMAVHGITDEMVAGKRLNEAAIEHLMEGVALVIAHNAGFDRKFVEERLPAFASLPWGCSFRDIPWDEAGIGSAKLEYLAYQYGFFYDGHRAEMDCRALLEILRRPVGGVWKSRGAESEGFSSGTDALLGGEARLSNTSQAERERSLSQAEPAQSSGGRSSGPRLPQATTDRGRGPSVSQGEGDSSVTALKTLLDRAREPTYRVWATGSNFDTKDVLKARGYRWDPEEKCWWIDVDAAGLEAELAWLKTAVYGGRSATVEVETLDAKVRYSVRSGKREKRGL